MKGAFHQSRGAERGGLGWNAFSKDAPLSRNCWDVPGSFSGWAAGRARTTVCGCRVSLPPSERFPALEARRPLASAARGCSTPDSAPALAGSVSVPGFQGPAVEQGRWQLKLQFICGRRSRERSWEGPWSHFALLQAGDAHPVGHGFSLCPGKTKLPPPGFLPAHPQEEFMPPLPLLLWDSKARVDLLCFSFEHLSTSRSDSQHLCGALDYLIYPSRMLGLNIKPSSKQQPWTPMFNMSLVPELLSFVQLWACQNFLNPQLILAGLDGVEPLETSCSSVFWGCWQLGGWRSGTFPPKG